MIKSSYSDGNGGTCVEFSHTLLRSRSRSRSRSRDLVPIRDSEDPHGAALMARADEWAPFVAATGADGRRA